MRALILLALVACACQSKEDAFTEGYLKARCDGTIPICDQYAGCVLEKREYLEGEFPGAQRFIVPLETGYEILRVRLLFTELVYPGTEFLFQVSDLGCGRVEQYQLLDVDIFRRAGGDGILQFDLEVPDDGGGDRLVEIFSDTAASWLLIVDRIEG